MASLIITRKGLKLTQELRRENVQLPELSNSRHRKSLTPFARLSTSLPKLKMKNSSDIKVKHIHEKVVESRKKLFSNIRAIARRSSEKDLISLNCTIKEMVSESSQVYTEVSKFSNREKRKKLRIQQQFERKYLPYWAHHDQFLKKNKSRVSLSFV